MASLVTSGSLGKVLLSRWRLTALGMVVTVALAAAAFVAIPPRYSSTGTFVLIYPTVRGMNSLLQSDEGLQTTASLLVQQLNDPRLASQIGLTPDGPEQFTVKNGSIGANGKVSESPGPFVTITAQSPVRTRSAVIVSYVNGQANQSLKEIQSTLKVRKRNTITTDSVTAASVPKRVWDGPLRTTAVVLFLGAALTVALVAFVDRRATRRRLRRELEELEMRRTVHAAAIREPEPLLLEPVRVERSS